MSFLHALFRMLDTIAPAPVARAHCDIPCGIYDPHRALMAAHTVVRMVTLAQELEQKHEQHDADFRNSMIRYIATKEEHAEVCKHEVRILWGDYFKPEHLQKHPQLHELVWKAMKLGSKARQEANLQAAEELLETVNKIAEIFWETKGIKTVRVKAPYPTARETVYPKL
ncbi:MAG: superoxide dismutase, Ni [Candidatus Aenigmarchaeota archaeon]|nr:superoxide dismutase, Ni [Candidatus Aenigmarchaeota archaeon]